MEFLKSHYEKVLLSAVLLGLAVVAAMLPLKVGESTTPLPPPPGKSGFEPTNISTNEAVLAQLTNGTKTVLSGNHNLFNPVKWRRNVYRGVTNVTKFETEEKTGVGALIATNLTPLNLVVSYEGPVVSGDSVRYRIGIMHEEEPTRVNRTMVPWPVAPQEKSESGGFVLLDVKGPRENPSALDIELPKYGKRISISKENPFKLALGYKVDLYYPPDNKVFRDMRAKSFSSSSTPSEYTMVISGETNIIVAIETNEVKLASKATDTRNSIPVHTAP
jgi:hypothetical protein